MVHEPKDGTRTLPSYVLAVDPGTEVSGAVLFDVASNRPAWIKTSIPNHLLLDVIQTNPWQKTVLAVEMVASYGMPVGQEVFETVLWTGRFIQAFGARHTTKVYRLDVKMEMCGSARAKDGNIRQAIMDRFPGTGGGATPVVGTKKQPGPLYGVSKHAWAALGVALTWIEKMKRGDYAVT